MTALTEETALRLIAVIEKLTEVVSTMSPWTGGQTGGNVHPPVHPNVHRDIIRKEKERVKKQRHRARRRAALSTPLSTPLSTGDKVDKIPLLKEEEERGLEGEERKEGKIITTTARDRPEVAVGVSHNPKSNGKQPIPKATRLSEEWMPEAEDADIGYDMGLDEKQVRLEFAKFKDYWRAVPGQRGMKLNWNATFRNWLRKAADDAGRRRQAQGH